MKTVAEHIERNQSPYAVARAVCDRAGMLPAQLMAAHRVVMAEALADAAYVRLDQILEGKLHGAQTIAERAAMEAEENLAEAVDAFTHTCGNLTVEIANADR